MALGIVSDEEFNKALQEPQHREAVIVPVIIPTPQEHGRNKGDNNVPSALRNIIGETSIIDGRKEALALADKFGISPSSVSAYNASKTSTSATQKNTDIKNHLNKVKENISRKARRLMVKAIDTIDDDKLEKCDAVELASVARHMGAIFKDMQPDVESENNKGQNGPTFVFMVPPMVKEDKYPVITVRD